MNQPIPSQPAAAAADLATKDELRTYYATKTDLAELKADLANLKSDLKSDITSAFRWTIVAMLGGISAATTAIGLIVTLAD